MNTSQIGQDNFVLQKLNNKKNGVFVDIGCGCPKFISNTYSLETLHNWTGIGVDIDELVEPDTKETWSQLRPNTKLIVHDALKLDYEEIFKNNKLPKVIDYLSLDLEPPELTLECLFKIPFYDYKFRVITFETDEYRAGEKRRDISREYLASFGYALVGNVNRQDDFYILPSEIEQR
jgi:hypothetical protein